MATTVQRWSGREVRALREAKRMTLRDFAGHLGVSERMVSKWEGENVIPRPVNQLALDTSLAAATPGEQARFAEALGITPTAVGGRIVRSPDQAATPANESEIPIGDENMVRHPIDGKLMTLVDAGVFFSGPEDEPVYLPAFYIDVFPTTNADYARFVAATDAKPPQHWNNGEPPEGLLDHPVVFVTWHDANAYAEWSAKALPTSQQWEKRREVPGETSIRGVANGHPRSATAVSTGSGVRLPSTATPAASARMACTTCAVTRGSGARPSRRRVGTS